MTIARRQAALPSRPKVTTLAPAKTLLAATRMEAEELNEARK
jgi:hypothetical protein